ncbi:MAG: MotA/TolQ/ExbB proton channel family protein, partial [Planctomycetia bacterium]|nr:MotA/TolQ/ExbB proton channel family protein [Planctomycetia bacterium]
MDAFIKFIKEDWMFAIPLFLMSLVGLMLVLWRMLLNWNASTNMNEFLPVFQDKLEKEGVPGALALCKARTDAIPKRMYVAGLETAK